jgi:hypothetical protein
MSYFILREQIPDFYHYFLFCNFVNCTLLFTNSKNPSQSIYQIMSMFQNSTYLFFFLARVNYQVFLISFLFLRQSLTI